MKKTALAAALLLSTGFAQANTVTSITVTGGHFSMGQAWDTPGLTCTAATSSDFGSCHELAAGGANTITAGDTGAAKTDTTAFSPDIVHFNFFGSPQVTGGIAPTAVGGAAANDWTSGFSGSTDTGAGTMDLNLGGYYANWTGTNFLQGTDSTGAILTADDGVTTGSSSTSASGTISGNTFDIEWSSFIVGGAFDGQTGFWHFTGTFTDVPDEVPLPAAVWLFGSGLVGLAGVARRRKAS